jgi:hypothetical protein
MTISTELTKISYQANGSTTVWNFTFPGGPNPDIHLIVTPPGGSPTEILSNFKVNVNPPVDPNPTSIGGSVIYPVTGSPLTVGNRVTIFRDVPLIQPTSFANQGTIYQEVIEETFDYVVEEIQQLDERLDRVLTVPITEDGPLVIPPCPERANKFLAFDENCKPIAVGNANPITSTNGIRVPSDETVPPLPARPARPGAFISFDNNGDPILAALPPPNLQPLLGQRVTITGAHTVVNTEKGFLLQLSGNTFYDLILGDPTTYDADFSIAVFNGDVYTGPGSGRAKRVMFNGTIMPGGVLWPGQWIYIFRYGNTWVSNPRDQRWKPGVSPTFYVDPILGKDDGTTDGLATGSGASKTVGVAVAVAMARVDYSGILGFAGGGIIQLAQGTYTEDIMVNFTPVGGIPLTIKGADDGADPTPWLIQVGAGEKGIQIDLSCTAIIKGLYFTALGNDAQGVVASRGSTLFMNNCRFGTFPGGATTPRGYAIFAHDNSTLVLRDINFTGNSYVAIFIMRHCTCRLSGAITVGNGLSFAIFIYGVFHSDFVGGTFTIGDPTDFHIVGGTGVTGKKWAALYDTVIYFGPGVADTLPGNTAGTAGDPAVLHGVDASGVW